MANILVARAQTTRAAGSLCKRLSLALPRLAPEGASTTVEMCHAERVVAASYGGASVPPVCRDDQSGYTLVGSILGQTRVGDGVVEGSGAIARWQPDGTLEVASDVTAGRTWWIGERDGVVVASTSMRAATLVLGVHAWDADALRWMLLTGALAPRRSWNEHLRGLGPAETACALPNAPWTYTQASWSFSESSGSAAEIRDRVRGELQAAFADIGRDTREWTLPLSGGVDSRAILSLWPDPKPPTVTWGASAKRREPNGDAAVAAAVAEAYGVPNAFVALDGVAVDATTITERFIDSGEGRIDHTSGYMDGFALWRELAGQGSGAVLRGDEAFGWSKVFRPLDTFTSVGMTALVKWRGMPREADTVLGGVTAPLWTQRGAGESLEDFRDRLYLEYRLPTVLAALTALKTPYVELANPLLQRRVLQMVRTLPAAWRTNKRAFLEALDGLGPNIPYAKLPSTEPASDLLRSEALCQSIAETLRNSASSSPLPEETSLYLADRVVAPRAEARSRKQHLEAFRGYVPSSWKPIARVLLGKPTVQSRTWAFRMYLGAEMHRRLTEDATALAAVE
jgi:hypothetical protein